MSESGPSLVVRGSNGLCLQAPPDFNIHSGFSPDLSRSVKVFAWSRDGAGLAWSNTGGAGRPQPDNREGNEVCLAVLNNFYNDGVKFHDVSCHHRKPVICEE